MPGITSSLLLALLSQTTMRASVSSAGVEGNARSQTAKVSADGRYVVFESFASNLVAGDANSHYDVFRYDRTTGTVLRVSLRNNGGESNGDSSNAAISSDGSVIAFESAATNLISGDTNGAIDVFIRDLNTSQTIRISRDGSGAQSPTGGTQPSISADGKRITFASNSALVSGDLNGLTDIYLRDRVASTTTRISVSATGGDTDGPSTEARISADGTLVVYTTTATNIAGSDTNSTYDIYGRDLTPGTNLRISLAYDGSEPDFFSSHASISADRRFVVFQSQADNLVPGDINIADDSFIVELATGAIEMVSVDSLDQLVPLGGAAAAISADGRFVAFESASTGLVDGDLNGVRDVFVRDRTLHMTTRVDVPDAGGEGDANSGAPSISDDGAIVAYESLATNLVPGDNNHEVDVFFRERNLTPASWSNYGVGLAGTKGVPTIALSALPLLNTSFTIDLANSSKWYTVGVLVIGLQRATLPGFGGTLLVDPLVLEPVALPPGTLHYWTDLPPDELLAGALFDLQGLEVDAGAVRGVSLSPGLELVIGF